MVDFAKTSPLHVVVLYGGFSKERAVSLASGKACADALQQAGYKIRMVDVTRDLTALITQLTHPRPDVVFNVLHGNYGEDGHIQAILNMLDLPYTHSGLLASALAMDKAAAIDLLTAKGIPCPHGITLSPQHLKNKTDPLPRPYVIKPLKMGSSVGVYLVMDDTPLPDYQDWDFGPARAETYIPGRELTVTVMDNRPFCVTELRPHQGFYDYNAKYSAKETRHLCPAPIADEVANYCMNLAQRAHEILGCRGVSRADFRFDDSKPFEDGVKLLEVNTQPGMTDVSLVPEQARYIGLSFPDLVSHMVKEAQCDF